MFREYISENSDTKQGNRNYLYIKIGVGFSQKVLELKGEQ